MKLIFDGTKIPKDKSIEEMLKETNPIQEFTKECTKNYESLIWSGLESFGITPDISADELRERVRIRKDPEWNGNTDVYVDNMYAFSVISVMDDWLEDYGFKFGWKLHRFDCMVGWKYDRNIY